MSLYRHTQPASYPLAMGAVAFAALIVSLVLVGPHPMTLVVVALLAIWLVLFHSMTVIVDDETIRIRFGVGLIHKTIPRAPIIAAQRVRNRWYYGWGIRRFPGGWLFNVAGLDAVELRLLSGRRYRIGSDEPERLLRALGEG